MEFVAQIDEAVVDRVTDQVYTGPHDENDDTKIPKCRGSLGMTSLKKLSDKLKYDF